MAWIKLVEVKDATGLLKRIYEAAMQRAGRVWNILRLMSRNPKTLKASMDLYRQTMFGQSALSRGQREMLAVIVSARNHCVY